MRGMGLRKEEIDEESSSNGPSSPQNQNRQGQIPRAKSALPPPPPGFGAAPKVQPPNEAPKPRFDNSWGEGKGFPNYSSTQRQQQNSQPNQRYQHPHFQFHNRDRKPQEGDIVDSIEVPHDKVGLVVGKQGKTVQRIERVCGVSISKPKKDEPPVFDIRGTDKEQIQKAKTMILSAAFPMGDSSTIKYKAPQLISTNDQLTLAKFNGDLSAYDISFRDVFRLVPKVSSEEEKLSQEMKLLNIAKQSYTSHFITDLEELLAKKPPQEGDRFGLQVRFGKFFVSTPPAELGDNFEPSKILDAIENRRIRFSFQTVSENSDVKRVEDKLAAEKAQTKNKEFYEITAIDNQQKRHLKILVTPVNGVLQIKKIFNKEGRLIVADFICPHKHHDFRMSFQRAKMVESDDGVKKFVSEMNVGKDGELHIPNYDRFHIEVVRHKIRSRHVTKDYTMDTTTIFQTEFGIPKRRKLEIELVSHKMKSMFKAGKFNAKQLIEEIPNLWNTILQVSLSKS